VSANAIKACQLVGDVAVVWAYTCRMRRSCRLVQAVVAVFTAGLLAGCGGSGGPHLALVARRTPTCSPGPTVAAAARTFAARANCFIGQAQSEVVALDASCSPLISNVPATITGSPPPALTDALGVLRRPQTASDRFPGSGEIGVSEGPRPAPAGPGAFIGASRRARSASGVTIYVIPAAAATQFRVVPNRCAREEADALRRALTGVGASLRARIVKLQRTEFRAEREEALNPAGIVLGTANAKAFGIDGTATFPDIKRSGLLDMNAGFPVRAVTVGVVPDGSRRSHCATPMHRQLAQASSGTCSSSSLQDTRDSRPSSGAARRGPISRPSRYQR
jgi:hypothetical protein